MVNRYIAVILGLFCLWIFSVSYSAGPGQLIGAALTASPGESGDFCAQPGCHPTGTFNQITTIEVADEMGNLTSQYNPGEVYDVSVVITAGTGTPNGYGFQMVALKDRDTTSTDSWAASLPNTMHKVRLLERDYVEHDGPMTGSNRFTVKWTAPGEGTGDISFYAAGNAVNLNGSPSGDDADTSKTTIHEAVVSSQKNLEDFISLSIFPNPATDYLNIDVLEEFKGEINIFSSTGYLFQNKKIQTGLNRLDVSSYDKGLYIIEIRSDKAFRPICKIIMIQ